MEWNGMVVVYTPHISHQFHGGFQFSGGLPPPPPPHSLRVVCGFFNVPQSWLTGTNVGRELRFTVLVGSQSIRVVRFSHGFGKTNTAKFQFDPECTDTFCSVIFKTSSVSPTRVLNPRSPARKSDAQLIN